MRKLFPLTVLALAGCGTGKSMTLDRPETLSTTTLPCGENELEHFRREYESCNKKAFSEIENNIDGSVKRPVNGNATCNAFDMLITECTKMLTFCFPDPQVQEAVEKQKNILKTTVELLLPDFEWDDCWNSLEKVSPSKADSSKASPKIVEETQQTETRAEETLTATTTTALPAPLAAASTTKQTTETATNALTEASSTAPATVETTTNPPIVTSTTTQTPRVIEVVEEILVPEQPKSSGASSAPEPEPSTESSAEKHRASALMACVVLAVSRIILT